MNSFERFKNRLAGKPVDSVPNFNIMMTFAAHFIKKPLSEYYLDYRILCEANFKVVENFGIDIVQAISDPYREAADLGLSVEFPYDGLPVNKYPLLKAEEDLTKLKVVSPESGRRMSDRIKGILAFKEKVKNEVPIMGWVEGALAEAANLRGIQNLLMDLLERPAWVYELLEICTEVEIRFAEAQVEAGADIIGLGDAIASQISPGFYQTFALPYEKRIFDQVKKRGAITRLHICGNTNPIIPQMPKSGADIIDLDWMVNYGKAASSYGNHPTVCGNFDPVVVMLQGTPDMVYHQTLKCLQLGGPRCFSMAGCEIPDGTPHKNLFAQVKALREFRNL
jgi:MtaA/CmuA family methyltransferase